MNNGIAPGPGILRTLRGFSSQAPLRLDFDGSGRPMLKPVHDGSNGAIATLLAILHEACVNGVWARFKGCRQCGYAFYDRSKNRSAAWCAMSICGNRTKNRAYRRRKSTDARRTKG